MKSRRVKDRTRCEYERLWDIHVIPALGTKQVSSVDDGDVRRLHQSLYETPYLANRVLAVVIGFFTYLEREKIRAQHTNPATLVKPNEETPRERFLTTTEFKRLGV